MNRYCIPSLNREVYFNPRKLNDEFVIVGFTALDTSKKLLIGEFVDSPDNQWSLDANEILDTKYELSFDQICKNMHFKYALVKPRDNMDFPYLSFLQPGFTQKHCICVYAWNRSRNTFDYFTTIFDRKIARENGVSDA